MQVGVVADNGEQGDHRRPLHDGQAGPNEGFVRSESNASLLYELLLNRFGCSFERIGNVGGGTRTRVTSWQGNRST
jgi:hypothetical protein